MIKLIIFDLWQTLAYRRGDYNHISLRKILKETKVKIPLGKFIKIFENSVQRKKWSSKFEAYKNLCKNMGLEPNKNNINLVMNIRENLESKTRLYSHTIPMLRKLKKQGYKIGLISNTSIFSFERLKKTGLLKYIDYPLFSFEIGTIKPDLKLFQEMLKIANCKPQEAIMVGDKMKDDVIPPRVIGMSSIHYNGYNKLKKDFASFGISI